MSLLKQFPKIFSLAIFIFLLVAIDSRAKGSYDDVQLPRPKTIPSWNTQAKWTLGRDVVRVTAVLSLSEKGLVTDASPVDSAQSRLFAFVENYLTTIAFHPLVIEGKKRDGVGLVRVVFRPGVGWIDVEFAIDSSGAIVDPILYDSLALLNGVVPGQLRTFPSFFCGLTYKDTLAVPPYVLLKLAVDTSGNVEDAKVVRSTMPTLNSQLQSAAKWAALISPSFGGKSVKSNPYLAVFFFPHINYPTKPLAVGDSTRRQTLYERSMIRLMPDSSRYLMLPLPRLSSCDSLYMKKRRASFDFDTITVYLTIDVKGEAGINMPPRLSAQARSDLREVSSNLRFYPALNHSGGTVPFSGLVRLEFVTSTLVRIKCLWLP